MTIPVPAHASARDRVCVELLNSGEIVVVPETGCVFVTRGPGGIRLDKPREVAGSPVNGYPTANLTSNGVKRQIRLHRLVWIAVHGIPAAGFIVAHQNNVKSDRRIGNLKLLTTGGNSTEAARDGLYRRGLNHPQGKLDPALHEAICGEYAVSRSPSTLATKFGVSVSRINQIVRSGRNA